MSKFTTLQNWNTPKGRGFLTTEIVPWEMGRVGSGLWVRVPVGFYFDMSVPWFLRWIFRPSDERYRKAAVLHDWALINGFDRVAAAALFNAALQADGVGGLTRAGMTAAVVFWRWK